MNPASSFQVEQEANAYFQKKGINQILESVIVGLSFTRPEDPLAYIESCVHQMRQDNALSKEGVLPWDAFIDPVSKANAQKREQVRKNTMKGRLGDIAIQKKALKQTEVKPLMPVKPLPPIPANELDVKPKEEEQVVVKPIEIKPLPRIIPKFRKLSLVPTTLAWQNIVFVLGGPGCGKGTQCTRLAAEFEYTHLSVGDLLRQEVQSGSDLGQYLDSLMKEGSIVPMDITLQLLQDAMIRAPHSARGFLIDGFPRQLDQAKEFESQIAQCRFVLFFDCPEDVMLQRLLKRGETSGRADDNSETIQKRFRTFVETSYPVIEEYQKRGKCIKISSVPAADQVYATVREYFVPPNERGAAWNNIVFVLGGPGSGKGTQCEKLAKEFRYNHISSGDLLRAEASTGSELGKALEAMMKEGKIVSLDITLGLLREAMLKSPAGSKGFLIDGFPREISQALAFESMIAPCKFVLYFECTEELMEKRLLKRGETSGRADDNSETIKKRFRTFLDASYPVVQHYDALGKCVKISSEPAVSQVYETTREYFVSPSDRGKAWSNIVLVLGGPGSGKGTQCEKIAKEFNYAHLSTGDILRAEVKSGSALGQELENYMKEGKIVPLDTTLNLLRKKMISTPTYFDGFLIDGFPRELIQAKAFEATVAPSKFVLCFDCPEDVLLERLVKRGETSGRADDNVETIKKRFATFTQQSYPVIEEYGRMGKLVKISSVKPVDEVYQETRQYFVKLPASWQNIVFVLGGPGSGKGTQCERIAKEYNLCHLSAGDLLRAEVATGSVLGNQLETMMKEGQIVPLETTMTLLRKAMLSAPTNSQGFLIDGFPRELNQAKTFEATLAPCKFVLYFDCPEELMEKRLLKRGETSGRADDNIETIKKRFTTFLNASLPVVKYYERQQRCVKISSVPTPEQVFENIKPHFAFLLKKPTTNKVASRPVTKTTPKKPSTTGPIQHPNIIFVLGGPGSGKGTQCTRLAKEYGLAHLSTGDLLREQVTKGTPIGLQAAQLMKEGKIVPMDLMLDLLREAIEQNADAKGFLLDGFPRAMDQALEFEKKVGKCKSVLFFNCPLDVLEQRLLERGKTSGRADDNIETIKKRFATFEQQSMPAVEHYRKQGKLIEISSVAPIDQVYETCKEHMTKILEEKSRPLDGKNIVFVLGGPGSGKGTQCERIVERFGYAHISSGDLLREEVKKQTEIGLMAEELMKEGKMVPMDITLKLIQNAIQAKPDAPGYLIDGFPRTMEQAMSFETNLGMAKFILFFDASDDTLTQRLLKRGETSGRADDNVESIKKRLTVFKEQSLPVVEYFAKDDRVRKISSEGQVDDITDQVVKLF